MHSMKFSLSWNVFVLFAWPALPEIGKCNTLSAVGQRICAWRDSSVLVGGNKLAHFWLAHSAGSPSLKKWNGWRRVTPIFLFMVSFSLL